MDPDKGDDERDESPDDRDDDLPDVTAVPAGSAEPGDSGETDPWEADEQPEWEESTDDEAGHTALPPKLEAWRRRSAAGAILTGFALGLQQALETRREEPSILVVTSGEPPRDLPVEADFEYRRPKNSVVNIRTWLLDEDTTALEEPAGEHDTGKGPDSPDQPGEEQS